MIEVVIDGNDGTGKTVLVEKLRELGYTVEDRGLPTQLSEEAVEVLFEKDKIFCQNKIFIILDCDPMICQQRLLAAGKSIEEKYHNLDDLIEYRRRFQAIANIIVNCYLIDSSKSPEDVEKEALELIRYLNGW